MHLFDRPACRKGIYIYHFTFKLCSVHLDPYDAGLSLLDDVKQPHIEEMIPLISEPGAHESIFAKKKEIRKFD